MKLILVIMLNEEIMIINQINNNNKDNNKIDQIYFNNFSKIDRVIDSKILGCNLIFLMVEMYKDKL